MADGRGEDPMEGKRVNITIWSDFVCPFCYIGQARMDQALEGFEHAGEVRVEYRSFILSPDTMYVPGQDYCQALAEQKGISDKEARATLKRVEDMGREAGHQINFGIARNANTRDAHRVLQYAREQGRDAAFFRRVYEAHFSEGELISDQETLIRLGKEAGLEGARVREILSGGAYAESLQKDLAQARRLNITAVPFFVFDNKYAMSGAQPADSFRQALEQVWEGREA